MKLTYVEKSRSQKLGFLSLVSVEPSFTSPVRVYTIVQTVMKVSHFR
jgi:hypothetical protein